MRSKLAISCLVVAGALLTASTASADYHLMKVSEVFPGTAANAGNDAFVELQMFDPGQTQVAGHKVDYYTAGGTLLGSYTIAGNVANGDNQRTILIGDTLAAGNPDFVYDTLGDALFPGTTTGGALCFPDGQPADCVSWGAFTGQAAIPSATGTPVAPAGIPPGSSITRSIAPGCVTLLEPADDSDNSIADFSVTAPNPRSNTETPTEVPCGAPDTDPPQTLILKAPPNKLSKTIAVYKFSADETGVRYECKFDKRPFKRCKSPQRYKRLDDGRHSFQVRATDPSGNVDKTPARDRFKVT